MQFTAVVLMALLTFSRWMTALRIDEAKRVLRRPEGESQIFMSLKAHLLGSVFDLRSASRRVTLATEGTQECLRKIL